MITRLLLLSLAGLLASSCASPEDVARRQDERTSHYGNRQEVRALRAQGRDDRDRMWYNRIMGRPVDDPGLPDF